LVSRSYHTKYWRLTIVDECEEESRAQLLTQLQYFLRGSSIGHRTKIIITSRPHIPVASYLLGITKIPLAANNLNGDITAFVEAEVQNQAQFEGSLGEEVRRALIDGANGMFLWVSLMLGDLKKSANTTPRAIRMALSWLPNDHPGVYIKILRQIRAEDLKTAQVILRWVVRAVRPLTLQELRIATAIMPAEHTSMSSMQDNMQTDLRQVLRLVFGPMLRIEDNSIVHLVHQSAKDFLLIRSEATEMYYSGHPSTTQCLSYAESNLQLALSCLPYLGFSECEDGPVAGNIPWDKDV